MRVYTPPKNKKTDVCSFLGILCGSVFFVISSFVELYAGLIQLAAFAFWAFGLWVACRYSLTYHYYAVDGKNFRVVKVMGKRYSEVCNISMSTGIFLKKESEARDRAPAHTRFDYCRNFAAEQKYVYYFEWNGSTAEIIFEPSEEFAQIMLCALEAAKIAPEEEEINGRYEE
jgi:hypothetical protein